MVFFSSPQEALEGVFTVIVTWPQAGATEARSTAHPHTQSQYIPPTHTFCFTQAVSPSVGTQYTFLFPRRTSSIQTRAGGWPSVAFALVEGKRSLYPIHDSIEERHQQSYFSKRGNLPIKCPSPLKGSQFYTCFAF